MAVPAPTAAGNTASDTAPHHQRVVDQREGLVDPGVHLNRRTAGVPGQRRHQPGAQAGNRPLLGGRQRASGSTSAAAARTSAARSV